MPGGGSHAPAGEDHEKTGCGVPGRRRKSGGGRNADWLTSFPTRNPNPVVEPDRSGRVLYANPASAADRRALRLADAVIPKPFDVERLLG